MILLLGISISSASGQTADQVEQVHLSASDSVEIQETTLGYIKALREMDPVLMKKVMHPQLAKRTFRVNPKGSEPVTETSYSQMIAFAESWNSRGDKFPESPEEKVVILDAYHRMATVRMISDNWYEYFHLVKTNGEWKIINMLWQHKDLSRYNR